MHRWANETKEQLADNAKQQQVLVELAKKLIAECNHTYPSGESAVTEENEPDGPDPWHFSKVRRCNACGQKC